MAAKLVFLVGLVGIGGYVGHSAMTHDPAVYPLSKAQVETMLLEGRTTLPRRTNDGTIEIWGEARADAGVELAMRYSSSAPRLDCMAVLTPVAADRTRVVADCGTGGTGSAIADTSAALQTPMFEEHIAATLGQRAFVRETVDAKQQALVMKNMGGMQREALKTADEMQRFEDEAGR